MFKQIWLFNQVDTPMHNQVHVLSQQRSSTSLYLFEFIDTKMIKL